MLTLEQIIAKLNTDNDSVFPREALEDAVLQQSAITPSHVILAMAGSYERASESLRISIGLNTSAAELLNLTEAIEKFSVVNA